MDPSFSHIQMVAIDCDETLLRSDNTVSEYTKDVLHRLQEKGIRITLATGRMYQTAKPVGMSLNLGNVPMILFSGGLIQELETSHKVFERTVPRAAVQRILQLAREYDWHIQSYIDDRLLCHHRNWQSDLYEAQTGAKAEFLGDSLYELSQEPNKLIAIDRVENIDRIIASLTPLVGDARHVSKGDALEQLARQYGIGMEHIVSFGNAENDISMLSKTSYAVAVDNAVEHAKLVSREVCGHHNADGVARWIEEHLL